MMDGGVNEWRRKHNIDAGIADLEWVGEFQNAMRRVIAELARGELGCGESWVVWEEEELGCALW